MFICVLVILYFLMLFLLYSELCVCYYDIGIILNRTPSLLIFIYHRLRILLYQCNVRLLCWGRYYSTRYRVNYHYSLFHMIYRYIRVFIEYVNYYSYIDIINCKWNTTHAWLIIYSLLLKIVSTSFFCTFIVNVLLIFCLTSASSNLKTPTPTSFSLHASYLYSLGFFVSSRVVLVDV